MGFFQTNILQGRQRNLLHISSVTMLVLAFQNCSQKDSSDEGKESLSKLSAIPSGTLASIKSACDESLVMDIADSSGGIILQNRANSVLKSQAFKFELEGKDTYKITNMQSLAALSIAGGLNDRGIQVLQRGETVKSPQQTFSLEKSSDGYFKIKVLESGLYLEVDESNVGSKIIQEAPINNCQQKFALEKVSIGAATSSSSGEIAESGSDPFSESDSILSSAVADITSSARTGPTVKSVSTTTTFPAPTTTPTTSCPSGSPQATLRNNVLFNGSANNPSGTINVDFNNKRYAPTLDSFLAGIQPLIWAKNSVLARGTNTRKGTGGSLRARVGVPGLTKCTGSSRNRAEAQLYNGNGYPWDDGKSYWVGFTMNPTVMKPDVWTFFQIHAPVNSGIVGAGSNSLTIGTSKDSSGKMLYRFNVIDGWSTNGTECGALCRTKTVWTGPLVLNTWTDFVMNFTLSSKGQGFIRLYVNGKLVYQKLNMTNTPHSTATGKPVGPNRSSIIARVGLYGPDCALESGASYREAYFDNFREAIGCDGYKIVDPAVGS